MALAQDDVVRLKEPERGVAQQVEAEPEKRIVSRVIEMVVDGERGDARAAQDALMERVEAAAGASIDGRKHRTGFGVRFGGRGLGIAEVCLDGVVEAGVLD